MFVTNILVPGELIQRTHQLRKLFQLLMQLKKLFKSHGCILLHLEGFEK